MDNWGIVVWFPAEVRDSLLHAIQTGPGAHTASYSVGTRGSFPWAIVAGSWSWQSPTLSTGVKNECSSTFTPPCDCLAYNWTAFPLPFSSYTVVLQIGFHEDSNVVNVSWLMLNGLKVCICWRKHKKYESLQLVLSCYYPLHYSGL